MGDRAALMAESCIEWVIADQASAALGMPTVAIPTNYADNEIDFILKDAKPRVMFVTKADVLSEECRARLADANVELVITLQNRAPTQKRPWWSLLYWVGGTRRRGRDLELRCG